MAFIPDEKTGTMEALWKASPGYVPDKAISSKPSASFIPDEPSAFTPDKPTKSFIPDEGADSISSHIKEALSFTPKRMTKFIGGFGGAIAETAGNIPVAMTIKSLAPESVEKAKTIMGLAGAAATGGWAFPAMFTAEGAVAPTLEKYIKGEKIEPKEIIPDAVKGIIDNIGNLLGNTPDAPSLAKVLTASVKDGIVLPGMKEPIKLTSEQQRAYGEAISAGLYLATMPSSIRKGFKKVGEVGKEVTERISAVPQIAKERGLYTEQQRILEKRIATKNPEMTPEQVKATAEIISGGKIGKVEPAIVETAIKTQKAQLPELTPTEVPKAPTIKPTPSFVPDTIPTPVSEIKAPVIEDLKGENGKETAITTPTAKGGEIAPFKYQDANQENLAKTGFASGDTSAQFEAGGDIFRELTKDAPDSSYIKEKINSINRYWDRFDIRKDGENLALLKKQWEGQPVNTQEQKLAKELNLAIIGRDKSKVDSILSKLSPKEGGGIAKGGEIAPELQSLAEEARKYKSADEFRKAVNQRHLMDLSNPEVHNWGRAFASYPDEPLTDISQIIKDKDRAGSYLSTMKYSNPVEYKAINSPSDTITVYRAVPEGIGEKIRIGDYVALDKKYAQMHLDSVLQGEQKTKGKIISLTVPKKDIVWGEADFTEWAYSPQKFRQEYPTLTDFYNKTKLSPKEGGIAKGGEIEYLYHNSSQRHLEGIANEGIRKDLAGEYPHGIKDISDEKLRIYLAEDKNRALSFGGMTNSKYPETRSMLMRVKPSALKGEVYRPTNLGKGGGGETWFFGDKIDPKDIEVRVGEDEWIPIRDYAKQQGIKLSPKEGVVAPEIARPPVTPTGKEGFIKVDMLNPAKWDSVRQFIEDDWLRVKRLIQQKGANVTETNNPYEAEIRYWGRIGARTEEADSLISAVDKDIVTTAKKLNISDKLLNKEIDRFLIARHAPERNAVHGEMAAGMTDKQAYEIRAEIAGKPYAQEVERIANEIQTLNNKTLDILLDSEVINKELYDKLRTMYKNHIPLNRVMSEEDDIVDVLTKRGFDVQGTGIKRAKGSELEIADILTNVVTNYKAALARAEKNIVDNTTLRFARDNNYFDGLFEEIKPKAIGKTFDGKIILEKIRDPKILPVREKGKQVYLKINDAQLAMALRGVNRQKVDGLMRGVKAFTRFYSGLMTRFNPEFVVSNKIRDLQEVAVYLASKKEIGFKGTVEAIIKDPISVKDVTDAMRGKDTAGTRLYRQMKMDGGTTGGLGLSTREQLVINLDRIRSINRSNPRKVAEVVLRSIDAWNTIFEDSSRLSVYRQALKQGVSRNKAAVLAKEASVNFNKMGTGSPVINALYMFSNASVQGTAKMLRAMRNPKVLAMVLTLLGGAVFLVNEYNDKKDKDWRKKISKWDRLNGINIVISTDKGIKYVTIPISWGLKPIKVFFDSIGDISSGYNKSVSDAVSNLVASTVEAYNPAGGTDAISAITPSILDLPVDIARNRSWTGGKIRPDWNNSAPASIQYFDSLKKKLSGQKFIETTKELGDKGIEISPADLNYAFEQLIGGAGRSVTKTLNTIVGVAQGKPQVKEIPFVSRFYRDIPKEEIREFGEDFVEIKKVLAKQDKNRFYLGQEAELAWDGMKQIPIENRKQHYMEIRKSNPVLADKIKEVAKEEQANLTYNDRLIKKLGVENGERSKYIWKKINKIESAEERKTYYLDMRNKKVITDEVARQIKIRAKMKKR